MYVHCRMWDVHAMKFTINSSLPLSLSSSPSSSTSRIAVFSINVLRDERVLVVAEQRPGCTDEEAFSWMNNVVPAVESIHGLNLYGLVLVPPNKLPRVSFLVPLTLSLLDLCLVYIISSVLVLCNILPRVIVFSCPPPPPSLSFS